VELNAARPATMKGGQTYLPAEFKGKRPPIIGLARHFSKLGCFAWAPSLALLCRCFSDLLSSRLFLLLAMNSSGPGCRTQQECFHCCWNSRQGCNDEEVTATCSLCGGEVSIDSLALIDILDLCCYTQGCIFSRCLLVMELTKNRKILVLKLANGAAPSRSLPPLALLLTGVGAAPGLPTSASTPAAAHCFGEACCRDEHPCPTGASWVVN
jgi:hypothetical protein